MTPLFASLEVIDDLQPHDASLNMAVDEALLDHLADTPVLRIYRWQRSAVSFGYFDQAEAVTARYPGRDLVRRWTGGGTVEHGQDFTYSLLVPRTHALTAFRAGESYRVLHEVVGTALAAAGSHPPVLKGSRLATGSVERSRACFTNPVQFDLLLANDKIAGAAQRRTRRGWLHQGSIQLVDGAPGIYERLRQTLPAALGAKIRLRATSPGEEADARALTRRKYGTDAWLRRV